MRVNAAARLFDAGTCALHHGFFAGMFQSPRTPFGPAESRDRAAPRCKIFEPAAMIVDAARTRIHLLNLSITGALCHGTAPGVGTAVRIEVRGLVLAATVMWTKGQRFGVAFAATLDQGTLATLVAR